MRDYEELVELIRSFACNQYPNCSECEMILNGHECRSAIERRAADAIEELLAKIDELWTQLHVEGRSLISEPPKEDKDND